MKLGKTDGHIFPSMSEFQVQLSECSVTRVIRLQVQNLARIHMCYSIHSYDDNGVLHPDCVVYFRSNRRFIMHLEI